MKWCEGIEVFCSDMWQGFINTAKAVFPHSTLVVDRFHFFSYLNKVLDSQRKILRRKFKDQEEFKRLKWAFVEECGELDSRTEEEIEPGFFVGSRTGVTL
jgi:transposase